MGEGIIIYVMAMCPSGGAAACYSEPSSPNRDGPGAPRIGWVPGLGFRVESPRRFRISRFEGSWVKGEQFGLEGCG